MSKLLTKKFGYILLAVIITTLVIIGGKFYTGLGKKYLRIKNQQTVKVDKSDPQWLDKYCSSEIKNLPKLPFANKGLEKDINGEEVQKYGIPDVRLSKLIPENKWYETEGCGLWYKYEIKEAYSSVGVEYAFDIRVTNTFEKNVDTLITEAMDKSWKKISPLSDSEGGRAGYAYDGFPLIFRRENDRLNTVEFMTANFGANTFFMNLYVYEK